MPRYFIQLSVNGTNYHGWQIQPRSVTVQSVLDNALSMIIKEKILTTGAGRTDTGVHAPFFMAHFESATDDLEKVENLLFKINKYLPQDIHIHNLYKADENWHARFSAISRTYHYLIARKKTIFTNEHSCYIYGNLQLKDMNKAAGLIMQYSDFTSFARLQGGSETNICKIYDSTWFESGDYLIYRVTANRFLRNMVRAMVGTMINIGLGKLKADDISEIIESKNRSNAGGSAKAKGLFLTSIVYPSEFGLNEGLEYPDFLMV